MKNVSGLSDAVNASGECTRRSVILHIIQPFITRHNVHVMSATNIRLYADMYCFCT
ncbi:MAG: hypothetical protein IKJ87_04325 [Ruminococcus sp.]|nr:hypothetical protein [Ruminococcus sp.]